MPAIPAPPEIASRLPLRTRAAHIVDRAGVRLKLASVNWYGAESPDFVPGGLQAQTVQALAQRIKAMGFNSVRLPWSNYMVECNPKVTDGPQGASTVSKNGQYQDKRALGVYDDVVRTLSAQGLFVILDNHNSDPEWCCQPGKENGTWTSPGPHPRYSEEQWIADWTFIANRYKDAPAVVGADLRNEPSKNADGAAQWGAGGEEYDWHRAAEKAGDAVLRADPNLLIMVEGIGSGGDLSRASQIPVVLGPTCPADDPEQPSCPKVNDRLVYAPHDYANFQNDDASLGSFRKTLDQKWGKLAKGTHAKPIWVGEFGTCNSSPRCVASAAASSSKPADCLSSNAVEGAWFANLSR